VPLAGEGGNAALVVLADADLDRAVSAGAWGSFLHQGQICMTTGRHLVQEDIYEDYVSRLADKARHLPVGNPATEQVALGPIIDQRQRDKVHDLVTASVGAGARLAAGGTFEGLFYQPTVLVGADRAMTIAREETFGPVAPLFVFDTVEDVIAMANDTEFGLASYFYARDLGRVWKVVEALEYGMVGVNTGLISTAEAPFGGVKASGIGREGSKYGIDEYLTLKYVCLSV